MNALTETWAGKSTGVTQEEKDMLLEGCNTPSPANCKLCASEYNLFELEGNNICLSCSSKITACSRLAITKGMITNKKLESV